MTATLTSREHLLAEIDRVDARVRLCALRARAQAAAISGRPRAAPEAHDPLLGRGGLPAWSDGDGADRQDWTPAYAALRAELERRRALALRRGATLRLVELERRFGLSELDVDVVLLCMAAEIDLRYDAVFAALQAGTGRCGLSVDLALSLLCSTLSSKLDAAARFFPDAPLLRHGLLQLQDSVGRPNGSQWLAQTLKLDERIVRYLLDSVSVEAPLGAYRWPAGVGLPPCVGEQARLLERALTARDAARCLLVHVRERAHGDGVDVVGSVCAAAGLELFVVDAEALAALDETPAASLRALFREARLRDAAIVFKDAGADMPKRIETIARAAQALPGLVLAVVCEAIWAPPAWLSADVLTLELNPPAFAQRALLWRTALAERSAELDHEIAAIAAKFRFSAAQIRAAATDAMRRTRYHGASGSPTLEQLYAACRTQSSHALDGLARRVQPHYRWDDIVLPQDAVAQLREVCQRVTERGRVFEQWGFANKLSLGRGLNVLFCGPSGTGKTMAAEIIAGQLRLDLYRIDLSSVVSKYIGETEKNLSRIFAAAETSHAILFFDEADALFGKRSEVKDAHDRYANVETSYLLQRMEEYEGITILATNLRRNLDDAFARRMAFAITFPIPDEAERLRIWRQVWPEQTPRDAQLDLTFMAQRFKLSGGNIKNIALAAAFLAASDGGVVDMRHVVSATRRELQKLGKVAVADEFGPYASHDCVEIPSS